MAAVRLAQSRLDRDLAAAAEAALGKIIAVLPASARVAAESLPVFAGPGPWTPRSPTRSALLRSAATSRRFVHFDYADAGGATTSRQVRPLACFNWESTWTLAAWCEHRAAFRSFRIDRMRSLDALDQAFRDEPGRTLPDFLRHVKASGRTITRTLEM